MLLDPAKMYNIETVILRRQKETEVKNIKGEEEKSRREKRRRKHGEEERVGGKIIVMGEGKGRKEM